MRVRPSAAGASSRPWRRADRAARDGDPGSDVLVYQPLFAGRRRGRVGHAAGCSSAICCGRPAGPAFRSGSRSSRAATDLGAVTGAVAQAARIRPLSRDRAVAGLQAAAAGRDAERVRLQLARSLDRGRLSDAGAASDRATGRGGWRRRPQAAVRSLAAAERRRASHPSAVSGQRRHQPRRGARPGRVAARAEQRRQRRGDRRRARRARLPAHWRRSLRLGRRDAVALDRLQPHRRGVSSRRVPLGRDLLPSVGLAWPRRSWLSPSVRRIDERAQRRARDATRTWIRARSLSASCAGVHAQRRVRPAGVAALVPRQGRDPRVQRLGVHDDLPADHHRDARRQGDARCAGARVQLLGVDANPKATVARGRARPTRSCTGCSRRGTSSPGRCRSCERCGRRTAIEADDQRGADRSHPGAVRDRPAGPARQALHDPAVLRRGRPARAAAGAGGLEPAARPSRGRLAPLLHEDRRDLAQQPGHAAARRRRDGQPRARGPAAPAAVLRHLGSGDHEPRRAARRAQPIPGRRRLVEAAGADRGRRGERRARSARAAGLPARPPAPALLPGGDRPRRPARRRIRASRASHGSCSPPPTGRILWYWQVSTSGWLERSRARPACARRAGPRAEDALQRRGGRAAARRLARATGRAARAGRAACSAISRRSPRGSARCAATRS